MSKHSKENCMKCTTFCCVRCNHTNYGKGCMKTGKPGRYVDWGLFAAVGVHACDDFTPRDWKKYPYKEGI
jgi:hypothetical protein